MNRTSDLIMSPEDDWFGLPGHIDFRAFVREIWCDAGLDQLWEGKAPTLSQYREFLGDVYHTHIRQLATAEEVEDYVDNESHAISPRVGWYVECSPEHPNAVPATVLNWA